MKEMGKMMKRVKNYKHPDIKQITHVDIMYNIMTIVVRLYCILVRLYYITESC